MRFGIPGAKIHEYSLKKIFCFRIYFNFLAINFCSKDKDRPTA